MERVNDKQKLVLVDKVLKHFKGDIRGKRFALWGLAFKPNTDDMREAPSLVIVDELLKRGASICGYDPVAMDEAKRILDYKIEYADDMYAALKGADALVVVTEWQEFKVPKFTFIENNLKSKVIFDGRNIYNPVQMKEFGYKYYSIGR